MQVFWEPAYNFNTRQLRGCNVEVFPFLRVFPPYANRGVVYRRKWILHFGWLLWTVIVYFYNGESA